MPEARAVLGGSAGRGKRGLHLDQTRAKNAGHASRSVTGHHCAGGSGKVGKYAVAHLVERGHTVLNIDLKPLDHPGVHSLITDLTDGGQALNALTTHFGYEGDDNGKPPSPPDAVVHFAAIPAILMRPDNLTYQTNVMSTYNVLEAAMPTEKFLAKYAPKTPVTRKMGEFEGPLSNRKIREVLGFKEQHDWRRYV